jgi:hypothetical protein
MKPKVLFIVTGDPRTSARPAEAVRIAAGVGASKRAEISVYLRGAAVRALAESPDSLVDEDNYTRYWPLVAEAAQSIYAQADATGLRDLGKPAVAFVGITDDQLAELAAAQAYVLRF